jgi:hypothetical protein
LSPAREHGVVGEEDDPEAARAEHADRAVTAD